MLLRLIFAFYWLVFVNAVDIQPSLILIKPEPYAIIFDTRVEYEFAIHIEQEQYNSSHTASICITLHELSSIYPYVINREQRKEDICSEFYSFTLAGFGSHTHLLHAYLRITSTDDLGNSIDYVVSGISWIFQTIDLVYSSTPQNISIESKHDHMDSLTLFKSVRSPSVPNTSTVIPLTRIIGMDNAVLERTRKLHSWRPIDIKCTHVSFYLKELQYHGANNRLLYWLFDNARFEDHGYCLSIVTSASNSSHNLDLFNELTEANVPIFQFECLSLASELTSDLLEPLSSFLYNEVQVVVAVNTFGDTQTDRLLQSLFSPFKSTNRRPFLLFDLPNVEIRYDAQYFDGIIAPSRYAGFHEYSMKFSKPVAVIYPPACSLKWIEQSPCYLTLTNYIDIGEVNTRVAKEYVDPTQFASFGAQLINNRSDYFLNSFQFANGVNVKNKVTVISANRLSPEKSPALLLYALKHLRLSLTQNEWSEFESMFQIDWYGEGPLLSYLLKMRDDYQLNNVIYFKGFASEDELIKAMLSSDVLINSKLEGETFGFVHTEAGVMGLPVIAFNAGANLESISSGVLLDPHSSNVVEELAGAIYNMFLLYSDGVTLDYRMNRCNEVKKRIAQWSIERHSKSLMDVIQSTLKV